MKPLTVSLHIGSEQVETLTPSQRKLIATALSDAMSEYYKAHSDEFVKVKG